MTNKKMKEHNDTERQREERETDREKKRQTDE